MRVSTRFLRHRTSLVAASGSARIVRPRPLSYSLGPSTDLDHAMGRQTAMCQVLRCPARQDMSITTPAYSHPAEHEICANVGIDAMRARTQQCRPVCLYPLVLLASPLTGRRSRVA